MSSEFKVNIGRSNTILYCDYWEKTIQFYRDILKFTITYETDWFVEFQITNQAYLSIADTQSTTISSSKGNGLTLSFEIGDLDKAHSLLSKEGVNISQINPIWGTRSFYIFDPEGHRIEFWT